jgi:hypothetical protein
MGMSRWLAPNELHGTPACPIPDGYVDMGHRLPDGTIIYDSVDFPGTGFIPMHPAVREALEKAPVHSILCGAHAYPGKEARFEAWKAKILKQNPHALNCCKGKVAGDC